jgi:hypothetical protein
MPTFRLESDGAVVNRSACLHEQAAWNWANNWVTKKFGLKRPIRLTQHVCLITVKDGAYITDHEGA